MYFAPSGLKKMLAATNPGRCPALFYHALSGQKHTLSFALHILLSLLYMPYLCSERA